MREFFSILMIDMDGKSTHVMLSASVLKKTFRYNMPNRDALLVLILRYIPNIYTFILERADGHTVIKA